MKKLIALISSVAIVLSLSTIAFAEAQPLANLDDSGKDSNGTQSIVSTTYDPESKEFEVKVSGIETTAQATLLAHDGEELTITQDSNNIEYIDQKAAENVTTFTFKMKTDPVANVEYTIKLGGSGNFGDVLSERVMPVAGSGYTISGTVNSALATITDARFTAEQLKKANDAFATHVVLKRSARDTEGIVGLRTTVDPTTKEFSITGVPADDYVLVIYRTGCVARFIPVTVDANKPLGDKSLITGDTNISAAFPLFDGITSDLVIESADLSPILTGYGKNLNDIDFNFRADLNADLVIESADLSPVLTGYGKNYQDYNDGLVIPAN